MRRNKNLKKLPKIQTAVILCLAILLSTPAISQRSKKGSKKKVATAEQISQEVEYLFIEAEKLFILKNYSQSTELLNRCIALDPDNDVVYYKLAEINNNTEQYDAAVDYIAKAIDINKSNKYYYLLAVDIHSNMGNLQEAANNYENLVKEVAKTELYIFNLAALYIYQK